ncbi:MAG: gamma-glutamyltransferase [Pseudomonadota bacterium]
MIPHIGRALAFVVFFAAFATPLLAQRNATTGEIPRVPLVAARHAMVATQETRATRIGVQVLERGGNAVDAAVAVGFAMAVTYPRAGNIGGGGFMLIHLAKDNKQIAIDYRETAPAATTRTTYLDAKGDADPRKSRDLGTAVGVPGTVAGLALAHRKYGSGKFRLADLIAPAIVMARDGIPVEDDNADALPYAREKFVRWPASQKIFMRRDGNVLQPGDRFVQDDLARTLDLIARRGPRGFYEGRIAEQIAAAVQKAGGLMTAEDLKNYKPVEREVVRGTYRGYDIVSMPPPSAGGILLIQMLNMLEAYQLKANDPASLHLMIEAMKLAYADRAQFLGDPAETIAPITGLMSKRYAEERRALINPDKATPPNEIRPGNPLPHEGSNTTHYSVVDRFGNVVSNTYTLNDSYGNGLVAEGTGVLLNNELDDFSAKPDAPNAFGLTGLNEANAPGPNKRPLSSMTPTIVFKDGKPFIVTGSPGGSRIITVVLQVLVNVIDHKMSIADAVRTPRIHHQWMPDQVIIERGMPNAIVQALEARGHKPTLRPLLTSANSIMIAPNGMRLGAADSRTRGALAAGY